MMAVLIYILKNKVQETHDISKDESVSFNFLYHILMQTTFNKIIHTNFNVHTKNMLEEEHAGNSSTPTKCNRHSNEC